MAGERRWTIRRLLVGVLIASLAGIGYATAQRQDAEPVNLAAEVNRIKAKQFSPDGRPVAVFTGSSSIRLWPALAATFPAFQVVNTGFGGSTMTNLRAYSADLIGRFEPDVVFIHEGDNDIALGSEPRQIMADARVLINQLHRELPTTRVVFISAKPSLSRWHYHQTYRDLNARLQRLAQERARVQFADVWAPMMGPDEIPALNCSARMGCT